MNDPATPREPIDQAYKDGYDTGFQHGSAKTGSAVPTVNGFRLDELEFYEAGHRYILRGRELESVTTKMRRFGTGFRGMAPMSALDRGRYVHEASVLIDENDFAWELCPEDYLGWCEAYRKARAAEPHVRVLAAERRLYHPLFEYAGQLDRAMLVIRNRRKMIRELKTGDTTDVDMQVAGYVHAYNFWFPGSPVDEKVGECLKLNRDGTWKLFDLDLREGWADFAALLRISRRQREPRYVTG